MNRFRCALVVVLLVIPACASAPPNRSPAATSAFHNTRVIKALDVLMDTAVEAHAQKPPLLSEDTTRKVVQYVESTLKLVDAVPQGWQKTVQTTLAELPRQLPEDERRLLNPYLALVSTIISNVWRIQ